MNGIAMVTGAARGIGLSIATLLARQGYRIVATDMDGSVVEQEAARLRALGLDVSGFQLDVTDRGAAADLCTRLGAVDVLVNNAGMGSRLVAFDALGAEELAQMVAVNAGGTFIVAQECARRMKHGGSIINIASRGYLGGAGASHYVASKAAVVGLTRAMAIELRWQGIRVNAIAPGMVETRMIADFTPETRRSLLHREPSGAPADPDDIAQAVAFLASGAARFVSGQVLFVDGGKSVGMPPL